MAVLALWFFYVSGNVLHKNKGFYDPGILSYTILFLLLVVTIVANAQLRMQRWWNTALAVVLVLFLRLLYRDPALVFAMSRPLVHDLHVIMLGALCLAIGLAALSVPRSLTGTRLLAFEALALTLGIILVLAQEMTLFISPRPGIDVFINNTAGVDYWLAGVNPYAAGYADIYSGKYSYAPGFLYFPGTLYWLAPFRWLVGDIRTGFIFANLVTASGLFWLARGRETRTRCLIPLLWLSFPVTLFVLEQSWTDTILVALTVLMFIAFHHRRWLLVGAIAGFAFAVKQHGFIFIAIMVMAIWRTAGLRKALVASLVAGGVFSAVVLPFALVNWPAFYRSTITSQAAQGIREDAFNFTIHLVRAYGVRLSQWTMTAVSVAGIWAGLAIARFQLRLDVLSAAAAGLIVAFGMAFFFGKWAFCNYYYLLAGVVLLFILTTSPTAPASASEVAS